MLQALLSEDIYIFVLSFTLRKSCPYSELFWSAFFSIWTEYGEILSIFPYSVRLRENGYQNNSKFRYFLCSVGYGEKRLDEKAKVNF